MIKIGKYEFVDEQQAKKKIDSLGVDENGQPTHNHAIVEIGHIVEKNGVIDEEGNVAAEPIFSEKYYVDVMWENLEEHPYGWKSYAVSPSENLIHNFWGIDYLENKL